MIVAAINGYHGIKTGAFDDLDRAVRFVANYARDNIESLNGYDDDRDYSSVSDEDLIEEYFTGGNLDGNTFTINECVIGKDESTVLRAS